MKRIFDFILSVCGILLSSPFWIIIAWGIWLNDLGSVFYFQERVGKDGNIFKSIQFRSMVKDAENSLGPIQAKERDPRITKLGRIFRATAMDELPQLLNIAMGQMSFVGPRALRPIEIDSDDSQPRSIWEFKGAKERSIIKPGLTGVAQVLLPRDAPREQKFQYDIWYTKNQTFALDLYLILISFVITFCGKWGAHRNKIEALTKRISFDP